MMGREVKTPYVGFSPASFKSIIPGPSNPTKKIGRWAENRPGEKFGFQAARPSRVSTRCVRIDRTCRSNLAVRHFPGIPGTALAFKAEPA
jgi:hypothetical protein